MQVFTDDGACIDVDVDGNGELAIVLLAGVALSKSIWNEQVAELSKTYRVVRPELRGMGNSSAPGGPYLMETLAADVAAVLDACGIERVTLVGHSLGGYVSLAFARMFAERVSRLALVCSRIDADAPEIQARRLALADRIEAAGSIEAVIEAYLLLLIPPETATRRPDLVERLREIMAATKPEGAAAMLRGMAARVASDDIAADLDVPMLVVAGSLDALIPPQQSRYAASAFPRGHFEVIEGSGHMPMLEYPDRITAALGELLALS